MRCPGFRFAGVAAGIKDSGAPDLALMASDRPADAAAIFTQNKLPAAPVRLSRRILRQSGGKVRGLVVNSGNANACTGQRGLTDAKKMVATTAEALEVEKSHVLVASTGVIGEPLPMEKVQEGIAAARAKLRVGGFQDFARAILTTDSSIKIARRRVSLTGTGVTLVGCTKGAGMIAPNMATTLTFVATDARVPTDELDRSLREAADRSFHEITIDGDSSTNDMIAVLAGGAAGNRRPGRRDQRRFDEALRDLLAELARALIRDGEGVHHVVRVQVRGAATERAARRVARSIAESPLVKAAIAGQDPNWGRVLMAAGKAGVPLRPERLALWIGNAKLVEGGVASGEKGAERKARAVMRRPEYEITLDLGQGEAESRMLACDLSHEYVTINAAYRT